MNTQINETPEQELARLRAENQQLKDAKAKVAVGGMKVSDKGALSVYGLGRFPVTLYKSQWIKLLAQSAEIQAFLVANASSLKEKES